VKADLAAHGFNELRGVVADAVLEDDLNLFDVFDIGRRVSLQHDDVGSFAGSERTNLVELAEEFGAIRSGDVNGLELREACLDEKFHFALVAESGDHAAVSCGIESREEQTAPFDEFAFELELLFKERGPKRSGSAIRDRGAPLQVFDASPGKDGVEDACVEWSTIGHEGLEYG